MKTLFGSQPNFTQVDPVKISYNVGCLMDIPSGSYVKGMKGENILNGGLGLITAIAGRGNTFKSTIMHYMTLSAASKASESGIATYINTYDTEVNISPERLQGFANRHSAFKDKDIVDNKIWNITDKTLHPGNEWFKELRSWLREEKIKNKGKILFDTPMKDKKGNPIKAMFPTFGQLDSLSEFETDATEDIKDKNEIGDSGGNTIHMRGGLDKTRLMMELPVLCNSSSHYLALTAHVGKEITIASGPMTTHTPKTLQHMRSGEAVKGVTTKFFFLTSQFWQTMSSTNLLNQGTKGPEYPITQDRPDPGSLDLNLVTIKNLRNKNGPSGFSIPIIVSQVEGVLDTLTEFHYIKDNGRWGLEGSNINYNVVFLPDVKLMRTTVRQTIDSNPRLKRAIKIAADLLQIKTFWPSLGILVPSPKDLYEKLKKDGYDWDILLDTRDYWTFDNYKHPIPFLSTLDLIEMYHTGSNVIKQSTGEVIEYTPWWYEEVKNKLKGEKDGK